MMRIDPLQAILVLVPPALTRTVSWLGRVAADQIARARIGRHDKLHLACGKHLLPGWANTDLEGPAAVIKLDLRRPLPVADASLSFIYAEHFIEHIDLPAAARLLRECHRVLKPGGVLRLSTPDLARRVDEYRAGRLGAWADIGWAPATPAQLLNEAMREWGHRFLFDARELEALLRGAGFARVEPKPWRQSVHPALADPTKAN
jgi:predicted SAM-dependent methyltransferase